MGEADVEGLLQEASSQLGSHFRYLTFVAPRGSRNFSPYNLRLVDFAQVDKSADYLTISRHGVTYFGPGKEPELVRLADWEQQYRMYTHLKQLRFFAHFLKWRIFCKWRTCVSRRKFESSRVFLSARLLSVQSALGPALQSCRTVCARLADTGLAPGIEPEPSSLEQLIRRQTEPLQEVEGSLLKFREMLREALLAACQAAYVLEGFHTSRPPSTRSHGESTPMHGNNKKVRTNNLSYVDKDKKRNLCSRLASFLRLVDCILQSSLHQMLTNSLEDFLDLIRKRFQNLDPTFQNNLAPLCVLELNISTGGRLTLQPSEDDVTSSLVFVLGAWQKCVLAVQPFSSDAELEPFVGEMKKESPSLEFVIERDENMARLQSEMLAMLSRNFAAINQFVGQYESVARSFADNTKTDVLAIQNETDLNIFRVMLLSFKEQQTAIDKVVSSQSLGVFFLHLAAFQEVVGPCLQRLRMAVNQALPRQGRLKASSLSSEVQEAQAFLELLPKTTPNYVEYIAFLDKMPQQLLHMTEEMNYVKELHLIMKEYAVPCLKEDLNAFMAFQSSLDSLKTTVSRREAERADLVTQFGDELARDVEQLLSHVAAVQAAVNEPSLVDVDSDVEEVQLALQQLRNRLETSQQRADYYQVQQQAFQLNMPECSELAAAKAAVHVRQLLWDSLELWEAALDDWQSQLFHTLDPEEVADSIRRNDDVIRELQAGLPGNLVVSKYQDSVRAMADQLPVVRHLRNPSLEARHWHHVSRLVGHDVGGDELVTLRQLADLDVFKHQHELQQISDQASSEAELHVTLNSVENQWHALRFALQPYSNTLVLGDLSLVTEVVDDTYLALSTISSSKYAEPIRPRIENWRSRLELFRITLDEWTHCQERWCLLEEMFKSADIQRKLPLESAMFESVNKSWLAIMSFVNKDPSALKACTRSGLLTELKKNNNILDQILKYLDAFLEVKRVLFPRFYFLSDTELLDIITKPRNTEVVNKYVEKCFAGISSLRFQQSAGSESDVSSMVSSQQEEVTLDRLVRVTTKFEEWLENVNVSMRETLRQLIRTAVHHDRRPDQTLDWLRQFPQQVVLTALRVTWCADVEKVLEGGGVTDLRDKYHKILDELLEMTRANDSTLVCRSSLSSVVALHLHFDDVMRSLANNHVCDLSSFSWQRRLRVYWCGGQCEVRAGLSVRRLGYEYVGSTRTFAWTPDTDKAAFSLLAALHMNLGGHVAGPPGCGKLETIRSLANVLAVGCVIVPCSSNLTFKTLRQLMSGTAQAGCWLLLTYAERLEVGVLSITGHQIAAVLEARRANQARFLFEGREIKLSDNCAAFITTGPLNSAGVLTIPESLKTSFRPVTLPPPDYGVIARVLLSARGVVCPSLALQVARTFTMCREQLRTPPDLRALGRLVAVLAPCQAELRLHQTLREDVLPRLPPQEGALFEAILHDLLGDPPPPTSPEELVRAAASRLGLQLEEHLLAAVFRLSGLLEERQGGVVVTGRPGVGKTAAWRVITEMAGDEDPLHVHVIYPQSLTWQDMFGHVDQDTQLWRNGLFTTTVQKMSRTSGRHLLVIDGPLNYPWVEGLGTIADNGGLAWLGNAEQMKLAGNISVLFETLDLNDVSPSFISRCNVVHIAESEVSWISFVTSWLANLALESSLKTVLEKIMMENIPLGFEFLEQNYLTPKIQVLNLLLRSYADKSFVTHISIVSSLCSLMKNFLQSGLEGGPANLNNAFVFSFLWSYAGCLQDANAQSMFEQFIITQCKDIEHFSAPSDGLLGKYWDVAEQCWLPWSALGSRFCLDSNPYLSEIVVPTEHSVRLGHLTELLMTSGHPVLLSGPSGCGKSVLARSVLHALETRGWLAAPLSGLVLAGSADLRRALLRRLERRGLGVWGAPRGRRVAALVEDVSMTCHQHSELFRQVFDHGGFHDRSEWAGVEDLAVIATCAPPSTTTFSRFLRHWAVLQLPQPNKETLLCIYGGLLRRFMMDSSLEIHAGSLTAALVSSLLRVQAVFTCVPDRPHYVFTQRCLARAVRGIARSDLTTLTDLGQLVRLAHHEMLREVGDRLTSSEDQLQLASILRQQFEESVGAEACHSLDKFCLFADFMAAKRGNYVNVELVDSLITVLQEHLDAYNDSVSDKMNLVMFREFAEQVSRVARSLQLRAGHVLVLGPAGSGRRSATRFATYLCGHRFVSYSVLPCTTTLELRRHLHHLLLGAVTARQDTVLAVSENAMIEDESLEDLHCLIKLGDAAFLHDPEFRKQAIEAVQTEAQESGTETDAMFDFFLTKLRRKLHVVVCIDTDGAQYRRQLRHWPALSTCCVVQWLAEWPLEALESISRSVLRLDMDDALRSNIEKCTARVHVVSSQISRSYYLESRQKVQVTLNMFVELLRMFESLYKAQLTKLVDLRDKCSSGLKKLRETTEGAEEMRTQLSTLEPELRAKTAATESLMKSLQKEQSQVEKVRQVVASEEALVKLVYACGIIKKHIMTTKSDETQAIAAEAQKELDEAMPAIEAAIRALETVERNDLKDIRAMAKPPALVKFVLEAVCLLMGCKTDWGSVKALIGDSTFVKRAMELDKDNVPDSVVRKLKEYVEHPNFLPEIMEAQSRACRSFCMWVRAVDAYAKTYRAVLPKKKRLEGAESELVAAVSLLRSKQQRLAETEGQIARLETHYDTSVAEQGALQAAVERTCSRFARAGHLAATTRDEQRRWQVALEEHLEQLGSLPGDLLLSAASLTYLGPLSDTCRAQLTAAWRTCCQDLTVPTSPSFSLIAMLTSPHELQTWHNSGLPRDDFSTENAIITLHTNKCPLLIDPHQQGVQWVKQLEAGHGLTVTSLTEPGYLEAVCKVAQEGRPAVLQDVADFLPHRLAGELRTRRAGTRLYLATRTARPSFHPDVLSLVALVNFEASPLAIEEQILSEVVRMETPDVELQIAGLQARMRSDRREHEALEQSILDDVCNFRGDLLDDEALINTLNKNKAASDTLFASLEKQEAVLSGFQARRETYRPVAARGSILFSVASQMGALDPFYQCSLHFFLQTFYRAVRQLPRLPEEDAAERAVRLTEAVTLATFQATSPGLRGAHQPLFGLLVSCAELRRDSHVSEAEWACLLSQPRHSVEENINTLSEKFQWFKDITSHLTKGVVLSIGNYKQHMLLSSRSLDEELNDAIEDIDQKLSDFQKLIIIKTFKKDQLSCFLREFILVRLGAKYVQQQHFTLQATVTGMRKTVPLIMIPRAAVSLSKLATAVPRACQESCLVSLAMARGQEQRAEVLLRKAMVEGLWLLLENCHLSADWLASLALLVQQVWDEPSSVHDNFRLFLAAEGPSAFPPILLQNSIKLCTDLSRNARASLDATLSDRKSDFLEDHALGSSWSGLVLALCHFDLVVRERSHFGSPGWSGGHHVGVNDLEHALHALQQLCVEEGPVPWEAISFYTGDVIYGNQFTNEWDSKCLQNLLQSVLHPLEMNAESRVPRLDDKTVSAEDRNSNVLRSMGLHETSVADYKSDGVLRLLSDLDIICSPIVLERKSLTVDQLTKMAACLPRSISDDVKRQGPMLPQYGDSALTERVLRLEVSDYNTLLAKVHTSLDAISAALEGQAEMSDALDELRQQLALNQVPSCWKKCSYPSTHNLQTWVADLSKRLQFLQSCLQGAVNVYWLAAFFSPRRFLCSVLQTHASQNNLPLEELKYFGHVMLQDNQEVPPAGGVLVTGLHLQCASWDGEFGVLGELRADKSCSDLRLVHFTPRTLTKEDEVCFYLAPLFRTEARDQLDQGDNLLASVYLATDRGSSHWTLRGVALIAEQADRDAITT